MPVINLSFFSILVFSATWILPAVLVGVVIIAAPYLWAAANARMKFVMPALPTIDPLSKDAENDDILGHFNQFTPVLERLGFASYGDYSVTDYLPNMWMALRLFLNRKTHEAAGVLYLRESQPKGRVRTARMLVFVTDFIHDRSIMTLNGDHLSLFANGANWRQVHVPDLNTVELLYRIHHINGSRFAPGAMKIMTPVGREVAWLHEALLRPVQTQVELDRMRLSRGGTHYHLTWSGAASFAWKGLWPFKSKRARRLHRESEALIRFASEHI
ncbi:MAG: hypothetical protein P8Y64_05495 [Gammaproteobacteria bacterium]